MNDNRIEFKNLEVGGVYDLDEYQGSGTPDLRYFVRIDAIENVQLTITNLSVGRQSTVRYHPYMTFYRLDSQTVAYRKIAARRAVEVAEEQLAKSKAALAILETV